MIRLGNSEEQKTQIYEYKFKVTLPPPKIHFIFYFHVTNLQLKYALWLLLYAEFPDIRMKKTMVLDYGSKPI